MSEQNSGLKHLILATAGHVDHGKTALIKALTGTETDRLPEEKKRGITIELGFAHLGLPDLSLGIIDVPGHEDFVRNMIAGIGSVDLALLVVAADDGWMPQTEEHLQILDYLGVRHGVVALTKIDLGQGEESLGEIRERLQDSSLGKVEIVPVSVRSGLGLEELKAAIARSAREISPRPDIGKPRLFVDRAFSVHGAGTVVTGTLTGGNLARGDSVALQPQNLKARIRAIQSHHQPEAVALPATRTALNLSDIDLEKIPRGTVITSDEPATSSRVIDVFLNRSRRDFLPSRAIRNASQVQLHYGSARFSARLTLSGRKEFLPGESALARLRLPVPVFAFLGDRFVLRDSSGRQTIAGGTILDPHPSRRFRTPEQQTFLRTRAGAPNDLEGFLRSQLRRDFFAEKESLLRQSNFSASEIAQAIGQLVNAGAFFAWQTLLADGGYWKELRSRAAAKIEAEHKARPDRTGMSVSALGETLGIKAPVQLAALVADLGAHGFSVSQGEIKRSSHRPSLPAALAPVGAKIRAALTQKPFDPPSRRELAPNPAAEQALRFLCETGEAVPLTPEIVLSAAAFAQMQNIVRQALQTKGSASASELRQALGTSRRILIPFLERCDQLGLTKREGDRRRLR